MWGERRLGQHGGLCRRWVKKGERGWASRQSSDWLAGGGRSERVIQGRRGRYIVNARRRSGLHQQPPRCGTIRTTRFVIKRYGVISLFTLCFRLVLGSPLLVKSRKTLSIRRLQGILMAEIPVKTQPLPVVRTVLSGNALALQARVVPTSQLGGDA